MKNLVRRGPLALEKTTLVSFPWVAPLIELENIRNFRFGAPIAIAID
jgi:hypothetical protein